MALAVAVGVDVLGVVASRAAVGDPACPHGVGVETCGLGVAAGGFCVAVGGGLVGGTGVFVGRLSVAVADGRGRVGTGVDVRVGVAVGRAVGAGVFAMVTWTRPATFLPE